MQQMIPCEWNSLMLNDVLYSQALQQLFCNTSLWNFNGKLISRVENGCKMIIYELSMSTQPTTLIKTISS